MSKAKKLYVILLAALLAVSFSLFAATLVQSKPEASALEVSEVKAETTIKVEFSIPEEARVGGSLEAGTIINRGVSLFNWIGDGNQGLKPGYKLAYDV